jgi:hypothetical protein
VCSLSGQHSLPFQLLGPPCAINRHDDDAGAIQYLLTDTIQFEEAKTSQSNGLSLFHAEFVYGYENISDGNVIDKHKCAIFTSAPRLSTSMKNNVSLLGDFPEKLKSDIVRRDLQRGTDQISHPNAEPSSLQKMPTFLSSTDCK